MDEQKMFEMGYACGLEEKDKKWKERIEKMKNEFIHIGETGWLDISLSHCLEIIDKYTKEQNNDKESEDTK